jgi:GT2 family glycosyltransferase
MARHRVAPNCAARTEELSGTEDVSWVTGAAIAVRREAFGSGFDESFGAGYFEDVDLCLRLKLELDLRVIYLGSVSFVHVGASCGGNPELKSNATKFRDRWHSRIVADVKEIKVRLW